MVVQIRRLTPTHILEIRRFLANRSGIAALEFALILPLIVVLYLGTVEISDALTIKQKVTRITSSLSDLVTQSEAITDGDMGNILDAAQSIVTPYPASELRMKVTGVAIDDKGVGRVVWSDARNDTPHSKDSVLAIPSKLRLPNSFLVTAEIGYTFTPTIGYVLTGSLELTDQFFLRPRRSNEITREGA